MQRTKLYYSHEIGERHLQKREFEQPTCGVLTKTKEEKEVRQILIGC